MSSKKLAIIAIVLIALLGGAGFGIYTWKQNIPSFRGIGVNVKGHPEDVCQEWEERLKAAVVRDDVLEWVVEDSKYASLMEVSSDQAVADLKGRVKVEYKKYKDLIEVGLKGKHKEDENLNKIADSLYRRAATEVAREDPKFAEFLGLNKAQ